MISGFSRTGKLFSTMYALLLFLGMVPQGFAAETNSKHGPFSTRVATSNERTATAQQPGQGGGSVTVPGKRKLERMKGRVMVKFADSAALATVAPEAGSAGGEGAVLAKIRVLHGFKGAERHFKSAKAPGAAEMIINREGKPVKKPDLTRWHRIEFAEDEDVDAKIAELVKIPGVTVAEPDLLRKPAALKMEANIALWSS